MYQKMASTLKPLRYYDTKQKQNQKQKKTKQRIAEHKYSSIGKHLLEAHGDKNLLIEGQFCVLKKCYGKFDCLVYEMLFIQELRPTLNAQSDSISAKLFA